MSRTIVSGGEGSLGSIAAIAALSTKPRARKIATAWVVGGVAYQGAKKLYDYLKGQASYVMTVEADDDVYPYLNRWLLDSLGPNKRYQVKVTTTLQDPDRDEEPGSRSKADTVEVKTIYNSPKQHILAVDGHYIHIRLETPQLPEGDDAERWISYARSKEKIYLSAYSPAGRAAVMKLLMSLAEKGHLEKTSSDLWVANRWGGWSRKKNLRDRDLSTIVLPSGLAEDLESDLNDFMEREEDYYRLGIPWHRGYLLYGPPGTGKTSFARALATRFDLDIYWLPLSDLKTDADLTQMVSQLGYRSMLLLEDIDVLHAAGNRDDTEAGGMTLSGLLNVLDGAATPEGLVTVMTTNHIDKLDDALLRPGRADRKVELGHLTQEQLNRLVDTFLGGHDKGMILERDDLAPAEVIEIIKEYLGDPEFAYFAIKELVSGRDVSAEAL